MISVVIPCFNESDRLSATVRSIARTRRSDAPVEVVIVDDGSTDGGVTEFSDEAEALSRGSFSVRTVRLGQRAGNYRARNHGAAAANGEVLVCTDAHVCFAVGWDTAVLLGLGERRILGGVVASAQGSFKGYGLRLDLPSMWTVWNRTPEEGAALAVAPCAATAMFREEFLSLGGYDEGMLVYAGGEGEFSIRAWLAGYKLTLCQGFVVYHSFKPKALLDRYLSDLRIEIVHNLLRFAMLYLEPPQVLAVIRHHYRRRPQHCRAALEILDPGLIRLSRGELARNREHDFSWLTSRLELPAIA